MKKSAIIISLLFTIHSFAQTSASSTIIAKVTLIAPIQIAKSVDLNFGNVIGSMTSGTLTLEPSGIRTLNGVQISNNGTDNVSPAAAIVTHFNNDYSISLPDTYILYNSGNSEQIILINNFTVNPVTNAENTGSDILKIGATLNLGANQMSGVYTNSTGFSVTVSYN